MSSGLFDFRAELRKANALTRLIIANVAVFVVLGLLAPAMRLALPPDQWQGAYRQFMEYLMLPSNPELLLQRPWTFITSMFCHDGLWHIAFNMLVLFWFGQIWKLFQSERQILPIFLMGGFAGGLFYVIAYSALPAFQQFESFALGASGGVMAIVLACAALVPQYVVRLLFIGNVELRWIALGLIVMDLIGIAGSNAGGSIAHLGGAAFGVLYVARLRAGHDLSVWMTRFFDWVPTLFKSRKGPRLEYSRRRAKQPSTSSGYSRTTRSRGSQRAADSAAKPKEDANKRLDDILDKINEKGLDGLTAEEKEFLYRASKDKP